MNKKVNKEDEESIQNKSRSWTSNIIKFSKNLLNDDFNLLPCLAGSIAMIIFIKYRKSIANLLSAFLLFIALLLPHFIQHFYDAQGTKTCYRNLARWIDFHSLICVTLFIYGTVYGPYYDTDFLFILKYAILLFITSITYYCLFYSMNIFILSISTLGLPYLFYMLWNTKKHKKELDSNYNLSCCNSKHLRKGSSTIITFFIFFLLITAYASKIIAIGCHNKKCFKYIDYQLALNFLDSFIPVSTFGNKSNNSIHCCNSETNNYAHYFAQI